MQSDCHSWQGALAPHFLLCFYFYFLTYLSMILSYMAGLMLLGVVFVATAVTVQGLLYQLTLQLTTSHSISSKAFINLPPFLFSLSLAHLLQLSSTTLSLVCLKNLIFSYMSMLVKIIQEIKYMVKIERKYLLTFHDVEQADYNEII